jgi:hypothetical protein
MVAGLACLGAGYTACQDAGGFVMFAVRFEAKDDLNTLVSIYKIVERVREDWMLR